LTGHFHALFLTELFDTRHTFGTHVPPPLKIGLHRFLFWDASPDINIGYQIQTDGTREPPESRQYISILIARGKAPV